MNKKIYISDIDTPLGYHLVEFFRDDHLDLENYALIVGTALGHPQIHGVYQTIQFIKQPQLACRSSLDCDVIILNLRTPTNQAEIIIKCTLSIMKVFESINKSMTKMVRIIGISTVMTWEGMQTYQAEKDVGDREKFMAAALDENSWKKIKYQDHQYQNRISNNFFIKNYELENMLLSLNKFKNIKASVLCAGFIYGKDSCQIQSEILTSLGGGQLILCGGGNNHIPLVHIDTLIQSLGLLIEAKDCPYSIIVDQQQFTQIQIKNTINEGINGNILVTGNGKSLLHRESSFLTKEDSLWNFSLSLISSHIFSSCFNKNSFKSYANQLISDFCEYTLYSPKQALAFTDNFQESALLQLTDKLKQKIHILTQEDIDKLDLQLIEKMTPPEPQVPKKQNKAAKSIPQEQRQVQHYYKQALQNLLSAKKTQNYVLICNKKMNQFISRAYFYSEIIQIIPNIIQKTEEHRQIQYNSSEFMEFFEINITEKKADVEEVNNSNPQKTEEDIYVGSEKTSKKDDNLIMINQYLLDNVLGHISQAKFNMKLSKKQATLKNFIIQLKQIYNRCNSKNLSTESKLASK